MNEQTNSSNTLSNTFRSGTSQRNTRLRISLVTIRRKRMSEEEWQKKRKFQEVSQFLRWHVFPAINFPRAKNAKYDDIEILDLLVFTGMRNLCTNEGYHLMTELVDKDIPTPQNILHHIRDLERDKIFEMYQTASERLLEKAKEKGDLGETPVDVAIDFTNIQYNGDKNDEMVKEVQPKDGTSHASNSPPLRSCLAANTTRCKHSLSPSFQTNGTSLSSSWTMHSRC